MTPEAPMGRRLVALSLHSGTEPTPGPLAYIPPLLPSVCLFTAPSCQAHRWAWQEQHQPGRYRAYSPVGQAHVKCRNTLRSHSDDAVKGTLGATRAKRRETCIRPGGSWSQCPQQPLTTVPVKAQWPVPHPQAFI